MRYKHENKKQSTQNELFYMRKTKKFLKSF